MKTTLLRTKCAEGMLWALVLSVFFVTRAQAVVSAGEYYIVHDFWGKLLTNSSGNPRLMAYDSDSDNDFIFVAEASGTSGYVKLKHKSSGKYLTASTSNQWSVLLSNSGSGDQYLWALDQLFDTKIVSKKNTGKHLGTDFYSGSTYYWDATEVPIYYNKGDGALGWFSVIPSNGRGFESSRQVTKTATFTNEYGVTEQDDYCVSEPVDVNGVDYHIKSSTPFEGTGCVNLSGEKSWLVFDAVRPSKVISTYLSNVTINGAAAVNGTNCRVEIYLRGAVVIPTPSVAPFVATTDQGTFSVALGNTADLGENSNKAHSFTLKRGYMATVATGTNGGDYSRGYVADHADLTVTLPTALDRRISSVYVRNWHYTAKSGYASTKSDLLYATTVCGSDWAWNWDANLSSNVDVEYIPIKAHLYWPADGNFYKSSSTAMMLFNEPEHSEQHTSSKCSCGGTISEWNAYTQTPKFNATGLRIGSPSATSLSWIKTYLDHCDDMKQRCDFSCTHGYWTSEWASSLNTLKGYGRPIWITEWEYGASWTSGSNPNSADDARAKVFDILEQLEYNNYVERYSYYEFDTGGTNGWMREMFWDNTASKGNAYVGQLYSRIKTHLGYVASIQPVPNWWAPTFSAPAITDAKLSDGKYSLSVTNSYGDATSSMDIVRKTAGGSWETVYSITDRAEFDATDMTVIVPNGIEPGDQVKVVITSILTTGTKESAIYNIPDYRDLATLRNLEFNEGTYVSAGVRTYAKDIKNSETSGLNDVTGWVIPANGDARAGGQFAWGTSHILGGDGYTAPATNSEGSTTGGGLGVVAVWTGIAQYVQNVFLEAGTYTLTIPVYNNVGGTVAVTKNLFGFIADDGTEYLNTATTFAKNQWTTLTVSFVLTEDTYGKFSVGYAAANKGSSDMPHLFIDCFRVTHTSDLPDMSALDDLQNLQFNEGTFTTANLNIGNSDEQKAVTGWTVATAGGTYHSGAQLAYGSGLTMGASGSSYAIPEAGTDDDPTGGALALIAAWNAQVQYTQAITLPAGRYTLKVPVYNGGGTTAIAKNLFGFVADNGNEYYASNTTFSVGEWTTMSVTFTLMEATSGKLSLGYTAGNTTSGNMPHLFADYMQINYGDQQWPKTETVIPGDVNNDGSISIADVTALVNIILGKGDGNNEAADVNNDGSITIADVTALVNIILGK